MSKWLQIDGVNHWIQRRGYNVGKRREAERELAVATKLANQDNSQGQTVFVWSR